MNKQKSLLLVLLMSLSNFSFGQDEQTVMTLFGRISQTDSIRSCLRQVKPGTDSSYVFHYKTPDIDKFGIAEFEFDNFYLNFDTGSNFLFSGTPFGNIEVMEISAKKAFITIHIDGLGDRAEQGKFEKASYTFINKKYRWMLKGVKYH